MGKWLKSFKEKFPEAQRVVGDKVDIVATVSTMSPQDRSVASGKLQIEQIKVAKLRTLIEMVGKHSGEDEEFLKEYIEDQVKAWLHDLDPAIACFQDLADKIPKPRIFKPAPLKHITCNECSNFLPDSIGDGAGIGSCAVGVIWTEDSRGRSPLYRYAERRCDLFSRLKS